MSLPGSIFFVFCALAALVGALGVVSARNPIRSAMGLLCTILGVAGLFLMLHAQLLAAIQLIVYAGAVVVLFVFVIMLIGPDPGGSEQGPRSRVARGSAAVIMLAAAGVALSSLAGQVQPARFTPARLDHGSVEEVGGLIFSQGLVPFELATVLLVVAIVGAISIVRGRRIKQPRLSADSANASERMYSGPIAEPEVEPLPDEDEPEEESEA